MAPSSSIADFRAVLHKSKNIIAIAGAGLSAGSGIPTWRGTSGLWRTYDPASLATPQAFAVNPGRVWCHYHMMRERALKAIPNGAHLALAVLCIPELLASLAPAAKFTLVTQNIDGLSVRALQETQAQSAQRFASVNSHVSPIYEMHGRVLDTLCNSCGRREHNSNNPLCPSLGNLDLDGQEVHIPVQDLPHCLQCGGLLRPGVVWFEEIPHHMKEIWETVDDADLCLVIGTSSTVHPAASYAYEVAEHGGNVAVFNMDRTDGDEGARFLFLGPCEETLPQAIFSLGAS